MHLQSISFHSIRTSSISVRLLVPLQHHKVGLKLRKARELEYTMHLQCTSFANSCSHLMALLNHKNK
jgi:hypothetical protein